MRDVIRQMYTHHYYYKNYFASTYMSHEFSPIAPKRIGTEVGEFKVKVLDAKLEGSLRMYHELAKQRYIEALHLAEEIDDKAETAIPFNKNAIHASMLLAFASLRGAEIS